MKQSKIPPPGKFRAVCIIACLMQCHSLVLTAQSSYDADQPLIPPVPPTAGDNCGFGVNALNTSVTGNKNTAMGNFALTSNLGGETNTANGFEALFSNVNGSSNTGIGYKTLHDNDGDYNTAVGSKALFSNQSGQANTAIGANALFSSISTNNNTAVGTNALLNTDSGNMGFGTDNTAIGFNAMVNNQNGYQNAALGKDALSNMVDGYNNTAFGFKSSGGNGFGGGNGYSNSSFGWKAMSNIYNGFYNTATGYAAMQTNPDGSGNSAFGHSALQDLLGSTSGWGWANVAMGQNAGQHTKYGVENTAVGYGALLYADDGSITGGGNVAVGYGALAYNKAGIYNTAAGFFALFATGPYAFNTAIGAYADIASPTLYNSAGIGYYARPDSSDKIRVGNANCTYYESPVAVTPSDGRFKYDVRSEDVKGLSFIRELRPVMYNFDTKKYSEHLLQSVHDSIKSDYLSSDFSMSSGMRHSGFIAQEVELAARKSGYNFSGLEIALTERHHYALSYDLFVVPLVKAVQEQQEMINSQEKDKQELLGKLAATHTRIEAAKAAMIPNIVTDPASGFAPGFQMKASEGASSNDITVAYELPKSYNKVQMIVYNLAGEQESVVECQSGICASAAIPTASLAPGIHLVSIVGDEELLGSQNIIISR
jgi:trimeric autotransporter adhesin